MQKLFSFRICCFPSADSTDKLAGSTDQVMDGSTGLSSGISFWYWIPRVQIRKWSGSCSGSTGLSGTTWPFSGSTDQTMVGSTGPCSGLLPKFLLWYWTLVLFYPEVASGSTGSIGTTGPFPGSTVPAGFAESR